MQKNSYNYDELISCGEGKLFGEGNAKLPLPPMLMFDRITEIKKDTGEFKKGFIKALIKPFLNSPVSFFISVILSNINIGGNGSLAFPSPNSFPSPHEISSS